MSHWDESFLQNKDCVNDTALCPMTRDGTTVSTRPENARHMEQTDKIWLPLNLFSHLQLLDFIIFSPLASLIELLYQKMDKER